MPYWVREILELAWVLGIGLLPVAFVIGLLNRRDRREAALLGAACREFPADAVRSDLAIAVRCALVSGRGLVQIDTGPRALAEVMPAIARLRGRLPPEIRVVVDTRVDRQVAARVTVDARVSGTLRHAM